MYQHHLAASLLGRLAILLVVLSCIVSIEAATDDASAETKQPLLLGFFRVRHFDNYTGEILGAMGAAIFLANLVWGRRRNSALVMSYIRSLLREDGVVERNFAVTSGEVVCSGADLYHSYASGRRFCRGMKLTFRMARRQDLAAVVVGAARRDILDIEVAMAEGAMHPVALFVGCAAAAKVVPRENPDLDVLAHRVEIGRDRLPGWPSDALVVLADQSSAAHELISPAAMDAAFGPAAFAQVGDYFRYLHATSDYEHGEQKAMLRLSLWLPPLDQGPALDRLLTLAMLMIDQLGSRRLTPEALKKALDARRKVEAAAPGAAEDAAKRREERRVAKEAAERARLMKLAPEQREKERARRDKILRQRKLKQMARK